ncbi:MAG: hypothetical protein N3G20_09805 [Verrucomicrobiae bacterium]|nr:hypothetical protein [Verrucomicrobiae bacterium]
MSVHLVIGLVLACVVAGCGKKREATQAEKPPTNSSAVSPLTAPADYAGAVVQATKVAEKVVDMASLKQAIQMFHAAEDRYPRDLSELVKSGYMPSLPKPPAGTKFSYDPARGEVKLVPAQ